jgi:hypothetical protein
MNSTIMNSTIMSSVGSLTEGQHESHGRSLPESQHATMPITWNIKYYYYYPMEWKASDYPMERRARIGWK